MILRRISCGCAVLAASIGLLGCSAEKAPSAAPTEVPQPSRGSTADVEQSGSRVIDTWEGIEEYYAERSRRVDEAVQCMQGSGHESAYASRPGTSAAAVAAREVEDADAFKAALSVCWDEPEIPSLSEELAAEVFDKKIQQRDCLIGLGYDVGEAPARDAEMGLLTAGGSASWDPIDDVYPQMTSMDEPDTVFAQCPKVF